MPEIKDYRLELTDFEEVALEKRDKEIKKIAKEGIATNMLKKGSNIEFISDVTGLTIEEVEELKKNLFF